MEPRALILCGGMGPLAGHELHKRILLSCRGLSRDQDYPDIWHISCGREIRDRTEYLLGLHHENPGVVVAEQMAPVGNWLGSRGVHWRSIVACATFHSDVILSIFVDRVAAIPGYSGHLDLVGETVRYVDSPDRFRGNAAFFVMATRGSHASGVWEQRLKLAGIEVLPMSAAIIERVHDVIYDPRRGLKTGQRTWAVEVINEIIRDLSQENRAGFILGCTEFSLISKELKESNPNILIVDPFDCLVSALGWSQS